MKQTLLPAGVLLCICFHVSASTRYVDLNSASPTAPYVSWATAATTIQDAIDVASAGDEILVTNGIYLGGGRVVHGALTNRVVVDKPLTLRSVNGPQFTIIQGWQVPGTTNGNGAIRCVYLADGASLSGFTLTNGATRMGSFGPPAEEGGGGGVWCESTNAVVSNCLIIGNSAWSGGGSYSGTLVRCEIRSNTAFGEIGTYMGGGGAAWGNLNRCTVIGNSSVSTGGGTLSGTLNNSLILSNSPNGAYGGTLNNCTVVGNLGVGAFGYYWIHSGELCALNNCIVYYNAGENYNTYSGLYSMSNCCTFPQFWSGSGNITNEPMFVNLAAGDFRLQPNSPCVDTGNNNYVMGATDLNGAPRICGSAVDMGAYEFQDSQPILRIAQSGESITLAWPLWAGDFGLQQAGATPGYAGGWSNLNTSPTVISNENTITMPLDGELRLFRLHKP